MHTFPSDSYQKLFYYSISYFPYRNALETSDLWKTSRNAHKFQEPYSQFSWNHHCFNVASTNRANQVWLNTLFRKFHGGCEFISLDSYYMDIFATFYSILEENSAVFGASLIRLKSSKKSLRKVLLNYFPCFMWLKYKRVALFWPIPFKSVYCIWHVLMCIALIAIIQIWNIFKFLWVWWLLSLQWIQTWSLLKVSDF